MDPKGMTRRDALQKGAVVSLAAVVVAESPAKAAARALSSGNGGMRAGRVMRIDSPRSAAIVAPDNSVTQVVLTGRTTIKRGIAGEVADLSSFVPGEEIVVIGEQSGSTITASQVSSVYRSMSGQILADDGSGNVSTTAGPLYLAPEVRARAKAGRLARGDQFAAEIWDDPKTGRPAAFIFRPGGE
jgi:hypothetical protein